MTEKQLVIIKIMNFHEVIGMGFGVGYGDGIPFEDT